MTPAQAAALLAVAAAFDNRKPDPDAAQAWAMALDGYRFEDCRDVIVAHYRKSREWLMPSDVIAGVKEVRKRRLVEFQSRVQLMPPPHLADDPAAEIQWFNAIQRRVMDGEIVDPSEVNCRGELKPRDVASLGQIGRSVPNA